MSLPAGLQIILQEGDYSDKCNLGIFDNLNDMESYITGTFEIVEYNLLQIQRLQIQPKLLYNGKDFPTQHILDNLQGELKLNVTKVKLSSDKSLYNRTMHNYYDFDWHILNDKYNEFLYRPDGEKCKEAEKEFAKIV